MGSHGGLLRVQGPILLKRLLYGRRGEPYRIGNYTLRFLPGTRPYRLKYAKLKPYIDDVARYDALQQLYMLKHLEPGMSAVDVGAHHGQDSLIMAALCGPAGKVTAFEPNAEARITFSRNIALNPGLAPPQLLPVAVSDADGRAQLFAEPGLSANSSLSSAGSTSRATALYEVETIKLDTWMQEPVDLVKIDVEGYEVRVLAGATRVLRSPAKILCELHPYAWSGIGDSYEGLCTLLAEHGRRLRYLDDLATPEPRYGIAVLEHI